MSRWLAHSATWWKSAKSPWLALWTFSAEADWFLKCFHRNKFISKWFFSLKKRWGGRGLSFEYILLKIQLKHIFLNKTFKYSNREGKSDKTSDGNTHFTSNTSHMSISDEIGANIASSHTTTHTSIHARDSKWCLYFDRRLFFSHNWVRYYINAHRINPATISWANSCKRCVSKIAQLTGWPNTGR